MALRENPIRALSLGLDTRRYTLMAFAIGSSLGGLSGALFASLVQFIEPSSFGLQRSFDLLLMVNSLLTDIRFVSNLPVCPQVRERVPER